jgi:integrase
MPYKEGAKWRAKVTFRGERYTSLHKTKKAATAWEIEKRKELKKEEKRLQKGLDLLTFCSKYQIYAERFTPKTHQEKKSLCERIVKAWGKNFIVENITPEMIQTYLDDQAGSRSNNASNRDRKNLMAMWTYGKKILNLQNNPLAEIEKRSHERKPQYVPPVEDILKVLMVANRMERIFLDCSNRMERIFLDCYLQTGARRSEIFRWTWHEDINFEKRKVRLGSKKSRDGSMTYRWVDMSKDLYDSLQWLWKNRKFKNIPYVWINDRPGLNYGKPYKYRHSFLKGLCKRAKVRPFGFSNVATTERYVHHLGEDLKSTVSLISEGLAPKKEDKEEGDKHEKK